MASTRVGLVAAGIGISFIPANVQHIANSGVVYRSMLEPSPKLLLALAWIKDNSSPVLKQFLNIVRDRCS